jgi:uncharacterized membrane protein YhiD involved in acid resistance
MEIKNKCILGLLLLFISPSLYAYIGPGMGTGAITAVLGILASLFIAIFALTYYPIKRWIKKRNKSKQ